MKVRVVDERRARRSRRAAIWRRLREQLAPQQPAAIAPGNSPWHRDGLTKWDFGPLPASIDLRRGGLVLTKYPALVDAGESVRTAAAAIRLPKR